MATMTIPELEIQNAGLDLAQKTVCIKVRLQRLGNTRKVSTSQIEVDSDKALLRVSKHLIDSAELRQITNFDSEVRRYLYNTCLPFEVGIHLCPFPPWNRSRDGSGSSPRIARVWSWRFWPPIRRSVMKPRRDCGPYTIRRTIRQSTTFAGSSALRGST